VLDDKMNVWAIGYHMVVLEAGETLDAYLSYISLEQH
jgi:hypothetical protein